LRLDRVKIDFGGCPRELGRIFVAATRSKIEIGESFGDAEIASQSSSFMNG
jgi:hypothetical protein